MTCVVSPTYTVERLEAIIASRVAWLQRNGSPQNNEMDNEQRVAYTRAMKEEYEADPMQQALIAQDYGKVAAQQMKKQVVAKKKHNRFHRELQRRAGTKQFWEVISYTGRTPFQVF